jgi:hypothetical protein
MENTIIRRSSSKRVREKNLIPINSTSLRRAKIGRWPAATEDCDQLCTGKRILCKEAELGNGILGNVTFEYGICRRNICDGDFLNNNKLSILTPTVLICTTKLFPKSQICHNLIFFGEVIYRLDTMAIIYFLSFFFNELELSVT